MASSRLTVRHHDPDFVDGVHSALDSLRTLAPNWDGYGAPAIDTAVIDAAKSFVAKLPEDLVCSTPRRAHVQRDTPTGMARWAEVIGARIRVAIFDPLPPVASRARNRRGRQLPGDER